MAGYPYRVYAGSFNEVEYPDPTPTKRRGLARRLTPLLGDEAPSLCKSCRSRKLDFRPLIKEPPSALCKIVDNDDLEVIETKNAVYIHNFSFAEAKAARSECSLCRLLYWSGYHANMHDLVPDMPPCLCRLRPRYDWVRHGRDRGKLIHRYQVRVHFEPIEEEMLFDVVYNNRLGPLRKGRPMLSATFDVDLLRYWLRQCDEKHSHPANHSTLVSRMQSIIDRGLFRVVNTSTGSVETMTSLPSYVALSYVWGAAAEQSKYQPLESRPISAHAPTIRDAAVLARSLGFGWLWIDRVCIDQTNESEKAILIPYMKDIYATAELTIAAACGDGAQSGLLGSVGTPRTAERPLVSISSVDFLPVALTLGWHVSRSVWGGRAWTYEEYVFSKRLLLVFYSEVWFNCGEHTFCESRGRSPVIKNEDAVNREIYGLQDICAISELHKSLRAKPADMAEVLDTVTFLGAVEEYSERNLTLDSDRVAAFAGLVIAALKSPMDKASEQALLKHGHPLRFFEILLTWEQFNLRDEIAPMPDKPFVPSWSWAASAKSVSFNWTRNLLVRSPKCWFQYKFLLNNDILGLPTDFGSSLIARLTGVQLPDGLIEDQPWITSLSDEYPFNSEARSSTDSPAPDSPTLPALHVVTLVFDARLVPWKDEKHILLSVGSTETRDSTDYYEWREGCQYMSLSWSIHPDLEHRYSHEEIGARPQPFEKFAILTGRGFINEFDKVYYDLYILLLGQAGQHDTYTRVGMRRATVLEGSHFTEVIKKGRPHWQYLRIV
ncbi:heterokaryon incompatibility protein-domain-containing protein [Xylaria sp. FL0043]|nr:heterokaryon incompatibility protein-domain-containing protein [Xylaria sp. FL0043]